MVIKTRSAPWTDLVVLCRKCSRKLDGGFGSDGERSLRSELRDALREQGRRRLVRIVESRCLGVCPKRAVTMMTASRPGRVFVVGAGSRMADVLDLLGAPPGDPEHGPESEH
jgi:predicted metal-binding protein